jgi:hypothetical protein
VPITVPTASPSIIPSSSAIPAPPSLPTTSPPAVPAPPARHLHAEPVPFLELVVVSCPHRILSVTAIVKSDKSVGGRPAEEGRGVEDVAGYEARIVI